MVKNPPAKGGDMSLICGLGRSPGAGNGNLLQFSCLRNPMDRGAWQATVHEVAKDSDTTEQLTLSLSFYLCKAFPGGSVGEESACNAGVPCLIPGLEGSPGEGNSNPLQYSCLRNPMDRGAWQATVHGVTKS